MNVFIQGLDHPMVEGSSGVKLPTTWTNRKVEVGRVREEKGRRKKIRKEKEPEEKKCRRAKMVGKSRNTLFFQCFGRVRSHLIVREIKNCTPPWRKARFEVKMLKAQQRRSTFGS
jgi:hypothetical protein